MSKYKPSEWAECWGAGRQRKGAFVYSMVLEFKSTGVTVCVQSTLSFPGAFSSITQVNPHGDRGSPGHVPSFLSGVARYRKRNMFVFCLKIKFNWVFSIFSGNPTPEEVEAEEIIQGHKISESLV